MPAMGALVAALVFVVAPARSASPASPAPVGVRPAAVVSGIQKIQHVIFLTQENRSFDSYFGTYPGADGIPAGVCLPDPRNGGCQPPFHDPSDVNFGGPHHPYAFLHDYDGGKMDGFVSEEELAAYCSGNPNAPGCVPCNSSNLATCNDVMGYHDAREIPNYWTYAQNFVLQDHMFESVRSWSLPAHLWQVSGWAAQCSSSSPLSCQTWFDEPTNGGGVPTGFSAPWTDITYLLNQHGVSWGYYIFRGNEPDCESDSALTCNPVKQGPTTPGIWNPLRYFTDVQQDGQGANIQSLNCFYSQLALKSASGCTPPASSSGCGLPNVSWLVPSDTVSEHPPSSIAAGQAYVTTTINSVMNSPCWSSTAIFLTWDDWGGFYDHLTPPTLLTETGSLSTGQTVASGYGIRVPGLVISPYARAGYIDHQVLSNDAYLKFVEDDFLGGERICSPDSSGSTNVGCISSDGRPDTRPQVAENVVPGDLTADFDFNQVPRSPLILATHPAPGPASCPPNTCGAGAGPPPLQLTVSIAKKVRLRGRHPVLKLVISCNLACRGRAGGVLSVLISHRRHPRLRTLSFSLRANAARTFKLGFTKAELSEIKHAERHHRVYITVSVSVRSGKVTRTYGVRVRLVY